MINKKEWKKRLNCPEGYEWVDSYRKRDGTLVSGFCREISKKQKPIYQVVDTSPNSLIVAYKGRGYIYDKKNHQWYYASGGKMDHAPFKEKERKR
jgi:hypothetical protein